MILADRIHSTIGQSISWFPQEGIIHMKSTAFLIFAAMLLLSACGGSSQASPTPPAAGQGTPWPAVPQLPGSTADMETNAMFNMVPSKQATLVYTTAQQPADIVAFYTNARMQAQGWEPEPYNKVESFSEEYGKWPEISTDATSGGCTLDTYKSPPAAFCTFSKKDAQGKLVELLITTSADPKTGQTMLTYLRMGGSGKK
jgi:hypothetical protein